MGDHLSYNKVAFFVKLLLLPNSRLPAGHYLNTPWLGVWRKVIYFRHCRYCPPNLGESGTWLLFILENLPAFTCLTESNRIMNQCTTASPLLPWINHDFGTKSRSFELFQNFYSIYCLKIQTDSDHY